MIAIWCLFFSNYILIQIQIHQKNKIHMKNKCKSSIYTKILTQPFSHNQQSNLHKKQRLRSNIIKSRTSSRAVSNKKLIQTPKNDYQLKISKDTKKIDQNHHYKNSVNNLDKLAKYSSQILLSRANKCNTNFLFGSQQVSAQKVSNYQDKCDKLTKNCEEYDKFEKCIDNQNIQLKISNNNSKQKSESDRQLHQLYFKNVKQPLLSQSQKLHPKDTFRKITQTIKIKSKNKFKNKLKPNSKPSKMKLNKPLNLNKNTHQNHNGQSRGTSNQKNRSATQTSPTLHFNSPFQQIKYIQREDQNDIKKVIKLQKCRRATTVSSHSRYTDYPKNKQIYRQHVIQNNIKSPQQQCDRQQINLSQIFNQTYKILNNYQANLTSSQKQRLKLEKQNKKLKAIISQYCNNNSNNDGSRQNLGHSKFYKKFAQMTHPVQNSQQKQSISIQKQRQRQVKFLDQQQSSQYDN